MIDWMELFRMQKELDDRILAEHNLSSYDLLAERVVALQVELAEMANEARWFKFWSKDRKPRRAEKCPLCLGNGRFGDDVLCFRCNGSGVQGEDKLLKEYVDAIHFAIGIGLVLGFDDFNEDDIRVEITKWGSYSEEYIAMNSTFSMVSIYAETGDKKDARNFWIGGMKRLLHFGRMFYITDDELVAAYHEKHAINHKRQDRGY